MQFDLDSPIFRHWTRELSRYHQYTRYDDRGCGLSDRNVTSSTFEDWVHDLETVIDAAGLDKFALLGMSQGGAVCIAYAARHPHRVTHLILYGASALGWWFNELQRKSTSPETAVHFLMEFAQIDVLDQLAKVSTPTLVIHTRGDLVNRFEDGRDLATLIPRAHFIPLESRNHLLLEDEPAWKDFLVETRRFLGVRETGPEPSSKEKELGVKGWLRGPKR